MGHRFGGPAPLRFTPAGLTNDNSPRTFLDGPVGSLVDNGIHALRVATDDGTHSVVVQDRYDILDVGIFCVG